MSDIFLNTPIWVWPLLLVLIALGFMQSRQRTVPPQPIILVSTALYGLFLGIFAARTLNA